MRILINATNLRSPGARMTGIELLSAMARRATGSHLFILAPEDPGFDNLCGRDNIDLRRLRFGGLLRPLRRLRFELFSVPRLVREMKPDILLSLGNLSPRTVWVPAVSVVRNPFYVNPNEIRSIPSIGQRLRMHAEVLLFRATITRVDALVAQTDAVRRQLMTQWGIGPERITVIPNALLPVMARAAATAPSSVLSRGEEPLVLFYPSRAYPYKEHRLLPRIARALKEGQSPRVIFRITVDSEKAAELEREAADLGVLDWMQNVGALSPERIAQEYMRSDALFFPSRTETFGNPLLEAMAFGLPILAADRPYAREIVGTAGIFFDEQNVADATRAIARLRNPATRELMSTKARERLREWLSWDEVAQRYLTLLEDLSRRRDQNSV